VFRMGLVDRYRPNACLLLVHSVVWETQWEQTSCPVSPVVYPVLQVSHWELACCHAVSSFHFRFWQFNCYTYNHIYEDILLDFFFNPEDGGNMFL
jgi:hypothetical protein